MSLLGTIAVLYFCGFTLNTFTLLGLSLAVGLVVDDAVMVMENIFRHAEMGKDRVTRRERGHQGDHLRRARRDARRHRHLPAGRLHEGRHRQVLPPVRRHALGRGGALVHRGHHARAGALRADAATTSRESAELRRARSSTAASRRSRAATAAALAALAARTRGSCSSSAVVVLAASRRSSRRASRRSSSRRRTRAASTCASRPRSARTSTATDALADAPRRILAKRPEVVARARRASASAVGAACRSRWSPPSERKLTQAQFSAAIRKELSTHTRACAPSVQDLSQQGFGASQGLSRRVLGARQRLGHARRAARRSSRTSSRESGLVDRRRQRLPDRRARARDRARPRARRPTSASRVSDIATTVSALVGGVIVGQYSTAGRRIDMRMRLLAAQRIAPRGPRACSACAPPNGDARPAVVGRRRTSEQAELQSINHADRERAITHHRQRRAPGTRRARRWPTSHDARRRSCRPATASSSSGQSSQFGDADERAWSSRSSSASSSRTWCSRRSSTRSSHPVTVLTILPLVGRRRDVRALRRRQDAQRLQHDRPAAADGHREEELDHPGRLRQRGARARGARRRRRDAQGAGRCACARS